MIVRNAATFTSDLPDDEIENDEDTGPDFIQYGGKSVIEAIAAILTRLGCVVEPPEHAHEHGWDMRFKYGKRKLWCQVTLIEGYVFIIEDMSRSFISKIRGRHDPLFLDILTRLAQELGQDLRFHDVLWFRNEDVFSRVPGAIEPVSYD